MQLLKLNANTSSTEAIAKPIGGAFVALGITTLASGAVRYYRVQNMLLTSYFPVSQFLISFIVVTLFLLILITLILTFVIA